MPLSVTGRKVFASMKRKYGDKKGEEVYYATMNKDPKLKKAWEGKAKYSNRPVRKK